MANYEQKQAEELTKRAFLPVEIKAWAAFQWGNAPWIKDLLRDRMNIMLAWAQRYGVDLSHISPAECRQRSTYKDTVKLWYHSRGWTRTVIRRGQRVEVIDPYAAMRYYSDRYAAEHEEYLPPWRKRERTRREKLRAIEQRFSVSTSLPRIK